MEKKMKTIKKRVIGNGRNECFYSVAATGIGQTIRVVQHHDSTSSI